MGRERGMTDRMSRKCYIYGFEPRVVGRHPFSSREIRWRKQLDTKINTPAITSVSDALPLAALHASGCCGLKERDYMISKFLDSSSCADCVYSKYKLRCSHTRMRLYGRLISLPWRPCFALSLFIVEFKTFALALQIKDLGGCRC